jgi:hypothetical protein
MMAGSHRFVWVSSFRKAPELIIPWLTDRTHGPDGDQKKGLPTGRSTWAGEVPANTELPTAIWPKDSRRKAPPHLFIARAFVFVSARAAEILRQFDLGAGKLTPVRALGADRTTHNPGHYFCWVFGNTKHAIDLDGSKLDEHSDPRERGYGFLGYDTADGDIWVGETALSGADVWFDPGLADAIFLSAGLGDALRDAGLGKAFRLHRASVG